MPPRGPFLWLLPAALLVTSPARAQAPPPAERAYVYSSYEQETIDEVLTSLGQVRDPSPEGKVIEHVEIVPLEVIERRDPLPRWVNIFHVTSRRSVIRRELLVREGEPYQQVLVDDTLRNLRRLPQLSAVLVVTTVGSAPDRVKVVVITKDVWSLRLNWDTTFTDHGLELFEAQPAEWNFLGTHQTLSGHFLYLPASYTFGLGYVAPRLSTSRVALTASADVVVNRARGNTEGALATVVAGQPLYSGLSAWAWDATTSIQDYIFRRYSQAQVKQYLDPMTHRIVPEEWKIRQYFTNYELTRSFGWETKHDFTFAAGIDLREYRTDFLGLDPQTLADFRRALVPVSDTRVGPSIQYHTYSQRFLRVIDFDTLALQEDHRLGHDIVVRIYPTFRALGSSRDLLGVYTAVQYTFSLQDGLFRASFQSTTEPEADGIDYAGIEPTIHFVTPTIAGAGRIVLDGSYLYRWRNYLNLNDAIGGSDRLRGYPTNFRVGPNAVAYNVEFRSRPIEILSCQLAGVAFLDSGDAFYGKSDFTIYQSVGVGLRALFPQLDRLVFRTDIGFPLERPLLATISPSGATQLVPIPAYAYVISFEQAFDTPTVSPAPVLPTGQ
jgi:hypothetical protein